VTSTATKITISAITESRLLEKEPSAGVRMLSKALLGGFKERFGTRLRAAIIVGQQLTRDMSELFSDLDIFLINTYGCLEAGGVVATDCDVPTRLKALPGVEMRCVNDKGEVIVPGDLGELMIEAPHAMQGYFNVNVTPDEQKNALVLHGPRTFVRTGDYAALTGQWLTVQGHKDVLITLNDGKVIDPLVVEMALIKSPFIKQAFVYGDRREYLTALIVCLPVAIAQHIRKLERRDGVPVVSEREKADVVRSELRRVSAALPARMHVRRFAFVDTDLTMQNGFITAKQTFARAKIEAHYTHYLNTLYSENPDFFGYAVDDFDDLW
jgi:long-chain acyl-CoA synthetase